MAGERFIDRAAYSVNEMLEAYGVDKATLFSEMDKGRLVGRLLGPQTLRFLVEDIARWRALPPAIPEPPAPKPVRVPSLLPKNYLDSIWEAPELLVGPLVYFLEAPPISPVKIGFTSNTLAVRITELQIGCPYKFRPLFTVPGTRKDEGYLHRLFKPERLSGEWFQRSDRLLRAIKSLRDGVQLRELSL